MFKNSIALALTTAALYGIAGPLMSAAIKNGASHISVIFAYGAACTLLMLVVNPTAIPSVGSGYNLLLVMLVGLMLAVAFWLLGVAFSLPNASPTILMSVVATYPLLTAIIEVTFKLSKVNAWQMGIGAAIIVLGIVVVATSKIEAVQ